MTCPSPQDWLRLASGELQPEEQAAFTSHARGCVACAAELQLSAALVPSELPGFDADRLTRRVLEATAPRTRTSLGAWAAAAALLLAVGGAWVLRPSDFTARGGPAVRDWTARVAAELRPLSDVTRSVSKGSTLAVETRWSLWYRNAETERPVYVMAYLVDGRGVLHWVAPTYLVDGHEPVPLMLPTALTPQLVGEVAQFDDVQPGPASLLTLLSTTPGSVLAFEADPAAAARQPELLLPGAVVWRRAVHLAPKETSP